MPFVPAVNTVLVEFRHQLAGEKVENTLYLRRSTPWAVGDLIGTGNALLIFWATKYALCLSSDVVLREIAVTDLTTATSPAIVAGAPAPPPTGALGERAAPNNVSVCVSFRSAGRGRSSRGRNYVTGIPTEKITGSLVLESHLTKITTAYDEFKLFAESIDVEWVIVSRFSGIDAAGHPIPRETAAIFPVTAHTIVDDVVDSQRRRLPGRGE